MNTIMHTCQKCLELLRINSMINGLYNGMCIEIDNKCTYSTVYCALCTTFKLTSEQDVGM